MSRRIPLPDEDTVRRAMNDLAAAARDDGRKPTVVALARQLGISHTTFWRRYPDLAAELVAIARGTEPPPGKPGQPGRYDQLAAEHAKLKRDHAQTQQNLERAAAVIQRLSIDNHHLRQQLEGAAKVVPLGPRRGDRAHPSSEH